MKWLGSVVISLLCSTQAHAFVCTAVPGNTNTVWWEDRNVHMIQFTRCSADVPDNAACKQAITTSMQTWTDVACSDFTYFDDGDTQDERVGYDWRRPDENHNVVIFREGDSSDPFDDWTHQASALAITTVTFNSRTGKILDADIEVNGVKRGTAEYRFALCADDGSDCAGKNDIQNTLTHELGHVLGLDHTPDPDATMYASAQEAETKKRSLGTDDINGICAIYPSGMAVAPCTPANLPNVPEPKFQEVKSCDDTSVDPCGKKFPPSCANAPAPTCTVLLMLLWLPRRRR